MWYLVCSTLSRYNLQSPKVDHREFLLSLVVLFRRLLCSLQGHIFFKQKPQLGPKLLMQTLQTTYEGKHAKMEEWCKLRAEHCQLKTLRYGTVRDVCIVSISVQQLNKFV